MIESSLSTSIHLHHDSDDERIEEVIDKLTNVTIGDSIDESKSVFFDTIMLVLGERKQKKLACNKMLSRRSAYKDLVLMKILFLVLLVNL